MREHNPTGADDPLRTDDLFIGYGGLLIIKRPVPDSGI